MSLQTTAPAKGDTIATLHTSMGDMKAKVFMDHVGEAATNFVELAKAGKYANTPFHRVVSGFVIQGGDFTRGNGTGGHAYKGPASKIGDVYHDELTHIQGALSWAKTSAPNSIGSQFFVVLPKDGTHFLDHPKGGGAAEGYTVFGQVFSGIDVLEKIGQVAVDGQDRPREAVTLLGVDISIQE